MSVDDPPDTISRPRLDPPMRWRGGTNPSGLARIPRYQLVLDGSRQDRAEVDEDDPDVRRRKSSLQLTKPRLDTRRLDGRQRTVLPGRKHVLPKTHVDGDTRAAVE